ncbi:hypothetical protein DLAC_07248 [Tieghemostelium lacteum]|uniref:R3H-associated N-terminal domain-containing protein n=1 Tax=Tieghemostelium lacteum TaxID=361077 RepID=A0A151ZC23_TIELA|nr:hypothetical protein DLAC_07248 [Tieghemostelium lacteum]|eukprot:KYQ91491.1 hypothetical protein DLAC_07248 [Tieghemostelium lacteum]
MASLEENRISELLWEKMSLNQHKIQKAKEESDKTLSPGQKFIAKKKKYYYRSRDSQAFRESPGKPGTKRFNRYLNNLFLKNASSLNEQFEAEMDFCHYEMNNNLYYQDNKNWDKLFKGITCERQSEILTQFKKRKPTDKADKQKQLQKINQSFAKLRKNLRPIFKKPWTTNSYFISTSETQIINFCQQSFLKSTEVYIPDPYQRLLLHGMVDYYSLLSKSYTNSSGQRCTVIYKPKVMPSLPEQTLTSYLIQEQQKAQLKKSIKKNNNSTTTTSINTCSTNSVGNEQACFH